MLEQPPRRTREDPVAACHPSWRELIRFCQQLQHGEIDRLVIQDGLPVLAEMTRQKVKFNKTGI